MLSQKRKIGSERSQRRFLLQKMAATANILNELSGREAISIAMWKCLKLPASKEASEFGRNLEFTNSVIMMQLCGITEKIYFYLIHE